MQHDAEPTNSELMSRLQRLEDMIRMISQNMPSTPETINHYDHRATSQTLTPADEEIHVKATEDFGAFRSHGPSLIPNISDNFIFETAPIDDLVRLSERPPEIVGQKTIFIPQHTEAREIFAQYEKHVAALHHILHLATLRNLLEAFYTSLSRQEKVNTDHAALLMSVFATVKGYTQWSICQQLTTNATINKDKIFLLFFRAAFDLVDHSKRVLPPSVEIIQACILVVFLDYNVEGFTTRPKLVLSQAIALCKELGMHRLDTAGEVRKRDLNPPDFQTQVDLEIKRRIWWHLTATDWMLSCIGNVSDGTYSVNEFQIRTRLPRNINDDLLDAGDLPLNQPTAMAYPLQRVRIAKLFRTVCDLSQTPGQENYQEVLGLDKRIANSLDDLPVFLRLDPESIEKSKFILQEYPYFAMHRYIINVGAQGLRCRLHQPYMGRQSANPMYKASTDLGLEAAMQVLKINKSMEMHNQKPMPGSAKFTGITHFTFLATVVIVKDLCLNRANDGEVVNCPELATALEMLGQVKDQSIPAQRFLDTMLDALKRHQVRISHESKQIPPGQPIPTAQWQPQFGGPPSVSLLNNGSPGNESLPINGQAFAYSNWQNAYDQNAYADMPDWDQLFSELDTFIA